MEMGSYAMQVSKPAISIPTIICLVVGNNAIINNIINKNMTRTIEIPVGTSLLNITQENNKILFEFAPKFKEGDFLYSGAYDQDAILIFKKIYNNRLYYYVCMEDGDHLDFCELHYWTNIDNFRLATGAEQQQLLCRMKKDGKQWNAEKLCIENIPQRKFKPGDKVKLKDGMLGKRGEPPYFTAEMDVFIGKVLTIRGYDSEDYILLNEAIGWAFAEDWLETYSDEPEVGELAIFWDRNKKYSKIGICKENNSGNYLDHSDASWLKAIKFESREQLLEHIKD